MNQTSRLVFRAILALALLGVFGAMYAEEALFFVTDVEGDTLFAVYPNGVVIKNADGQKLFTAESDSIRAYVYDEPGTRRSRGGFAIGGVASATRGVHEYFHVCSDSVRVFLEDSNATRRSRGGFAIGGVASATRNNEYYFNLDRSYTPEIIQPSQPRMLWYPAKEANRMGRVLVEHPDSVGMNSLATGFESKAVGDYSQALGYQARAGGDYSTAIGYMADAMGEHSFALGDSARTTAADALALGFGASAEGVGSYAIGSVPRDSTGMALPGYPATRTTGAYSFAIGLGAASSGVGSISIGHMSMADHYNAMALGYEAFATGNSSVAIGNSAAATGSGSCALGWAVDATGTGSTALGENTEASGAFSLAANRYTTASGDKSVALGGNTDATNDYAFASGRNSLASGECATATGYDTEASGESSLAMNDQTIASGEGALAQGYQSQASGNWSVALNQMCNTVGVGSLAGGYQSEANGDYSLSYGYTNNAIGHSAVALGQTNTVAGQAAIALGVGNNVDTQVSFAAGYGNAITTGQYSTAFGYDNDVTNHYSLAAGNRNEASGSASVALGDYNDAFGNYSLAVNRYNVASGDYSFAGCSQSQATGDYAMAWGRNCMATDEGSIALGRRANSNGHTYSFIWGDYSGTAFVNAIADNSFTTRASGGYAFYADGASNEENGVFINAGDGNVGIGVNSPSEKLHVGGNAHIDGDIETTGAAEFSGLLRTKYLEDATSGVDGAWLEVNNTNNNTGAMSGVRFQNGTTTNTYKAGMFLTDNDGYGLGNLVIANNGVENQSNVDLDDADIVVYSNGNVGIGAEQAVAPTHKLTVDGSLSVDGAAVIGGNTSVDGSVYPSTTATYNLGLSYRRWLNIYSVNGTVQTSDRRLKKHIRNLHYGLDDLMELRPVSFRWNEDDDEAIKHLGLIAQDTKKIIPEAVVQDDPDGYMGIRYTDLVPVLIASVQEQQKIIERQNELLFDFMRRVDKLEEMREPSPVVEAKDDRLDELEQRLARLEQPRIVDNEREQIRALEERVAQLEAQVKQLTQPTQQRKRQP